MESLKFSRIAAVFAIGSMLAVAQAPANDTPAGATTQVGPGFIADDNSASAVDGPLPSCGLPSDDVWYLYTPLSTGLLTVTTCSGAGSGNGNVNGVGDSVIGVFLDAGGSPGLEIGCDDDACLTQGLASIVGVPCTVSVPLYVSVSGWGGPGAGGTFVVDFVETPPLANDECITAIPVFLGTTTGSTVGASTSTPTGSCGAMGNDVWFAFTVPCAGDIIIDTCGSGYDTAFAVFDACGGTELGCDDDSGALGPCAFTLQSFLQVPNAGGALTGTTIFIALGGFAGGTGTFNLNIRCNYIHRWTTPTGAGSIQLENVDGPPNAIAFSAITLDILHPGLPPAVNFPTGWFFGVPIGFQELQIEISGPPFVVLLDPAGYALNFTLPAGTTSGLAGIATLWSVGVGFDPLTGFSSVADTTDPTAFPL